MKQRTTSIIIVFSLVVYICLLHVNTHAFPARNEVVLQNGMRVTYMELHALPLVHLYITVTPGSVADPRGLEGLSYVTIRCLKKGTGTLTAQEILDRLDFLGASFIPGMTPDYGYVHVQFLREHFKEVLRILGGMFSDAVFPEHEVNRERRFIMDLLVRIRENPSEYADDKIKEIVFRNGVYGRPVRGTRESLERITAGDVRDFFRSHYHSRAVSVHIAGDFHPDRDISVLQETLGKVKHGKPSSVKLKAKSDPQSGMFYIVDIPGGSQAQIRAGWLTVPRGHSDFFPLTVANAAFGGAFTSRLTQKLREESGLTYDARSYLINHMVEGGIIVSTHTQNQNVGRVIDTIRSILAGFSDEGIGPDELARTRNYLGGIFPITLQTIQRMAELIGIIDIYGLDKDYFDRYTAKIGEVTRKRVNNVTERYFQKDEYVWLIVGDATVLGPVLQSRGPVTIITNGRQGEETK